MSTARATATGANLERRAIALRVPTSGRSEVQLLGELGDWSNAQPVHGDEVRLEVPVGVYAYKFRVGGEWAMDPANPRTRSAGGLRNNVVSVGGAQEPILFAPAAPFVVEHDRGGLVVTAALRRGFGASLTLLWEEDRIASRSPMQLAVEEDEHLLFRARIGASAARVRLAFLREDGAVLDGDEAGRPLIYRRAAAGEALPAWWRRARVYAIFVDRFRPREAATDAAWTARAGEDSCPQRFAGGHLDGITRSLGELEDLGVDTLYLTPVHVGASCHRYDVVDPLRVDPALGGEEAFARLVDASHARGMRVIVDFSFSHAGRGMPAYEDVLERGRASAFASWFQWCSDGTLRGYGGRRDAPLFALDAPELRALVLEAASAWARRGVDGLRLDAAAEVPLDLARAVRARLRAQRPEAIILGEVVPAHAWRWRAEGAVDASTDFAFHQVMQELFARGVIDVPEALRRLDAADIARGGPSSSTVRFLSTHDHARLATLARASGHADRVPLAWMFLATWSGVPAILYGEELALSADVAHLSPEGAWPDRMPMPWGEGSDAGCDPSMRRLGRALLQARAVSDALATGETEVLHAERDLLVYRRWSGDDVVDVALHLGDGTVTLELDDDERPAMHLLAAAGVADVAAPCVMLGAKSGVVVRRARRDGGTTSRPSLAAENARARDAAFAANDPSPRAWPSRLDFAVTERCNLRCAHCITDAPARTRSGGARTLTPWLLDRLREPIARASYFGFVHGGESLTAPILFDVLRAIQHGRGAQPAMVHLLTNGVLLGAATTEKLVDHGVRSLAVSLDGARAETNDAVRIGGRFDAIVANLRAVTRLRRLMKADLRVGLSLVVMETNIDELDAFVDLAASCEVDWVKLEEVAPVTPFARRSLLSKGDARARERIASAIARAESIGLVAVDHTDPPEVWRCRLDARAARFLAADEHANRSTIHPCRVPWEHACVEPNGDVRLGDFYGQVLGSVAHASFGALWRGAEARAARMAAPGARLCGAGPVTCLRPPLTPADAM